MNAPDLCPNCGAYWACGCEVRVDVFRVDIVFRDPSMGFGNINGVPVIDDTPRLPDGQPMRFMSAGEWKDANFEELFRGFDDWR